MTLFDVGNASRVSGTNPNLVLARIIRYKDNQRLMGRDAEVWSDDEPKVVLGLLQQGFRITHYTNCSRLVRCYLLVR